jgi:hypothetical protein
VLTSFSDVLVPTRTLLTAEFAILTPTTCPPIVVIALLRLLLFETMPDTEVLTFERLELTLMTELLKFTTVVLMITTELLTLIKLVLMPKTELLTLVTLIETLPTLVETLPRLVDTLPRLVLVVPSALERDATDELV